MTEEQRMGKGGLHTLMGATLAAAMIMAAAVWWNALGRGDVPQVVILSTEFTLAGKYAMVRTAAQGSGVAVRHHYVEGMDAPALRRALDGAALLLLDVPREGDARRVQEALAPLGEALPVRRLEIRAAGHQAAGLEEAQAEVIRQYYRNGGSENMRRLFAYVAAQVLGDGRVAVAPPIVYPDSGIYHPRHDGMVFASAAEYFAWLKPTAEQPVIGVLMHQSYIASGLHAHVDDLIARIEANGGVPLAFYAPMQSEDAIAQLLAADGRPRYDVLVSFQAMYQGQQREQYQGLGVPVLQAITWRDGDAAHWRADQVGLPLSAVPFYLAVPEYAGVTDPLVVAAVEGGAPRAIPEQMEAMARKALKLAALQRKANADKKLAIFFYNYPPGEKNLSASFLNVPRSLANVTAALADAGYQVGAMSEAALIEQSAALLRPQYRDEPLEPLLEQGLADLLPVADYRRWFDALPATLRAEVTARWGQPEDEPLLLRRDGADHFVIPRIQNGNLMILPQPPRGRRGEPAEKAIYHDTKVPLNHYYMAVYLYARQQFGADALVHFGTHGTQEWTPGKERGLSVHDYPYVVLGDTPVFYPYIVDNIGEATQAKRRGRATIISHQTPPFAPAGLHEALIPVHDLIHQYQMLDQGAVKERTRAAIIAAAGDDLFKDLGWDQARAAADFENFQQELHDYLHELAQQAQPLGLHTFGGAPDAGHRLSTVMQMLGQPFYAKLGLDDEAFVDDYRRLAESKPYRLLQRYLVDGAPLEEIRDAELRALVAQGREHYRNLVAGGEIGSLLAGFAGRYIPTSYGGDPIRNPDTLPTGRNLYGFDPSKVPTPAAWAAGQKAVDALIEAYRAEHGRYPAKLAFSMWSVETMRHLGVLEAQVFHALGVRPVWDRGGRISGVEVVPAAELSRPRVDVVVSATGLYRDHFPNVMAHIADAVAKVAALDEPGNVVRTHTAQLRADLIGGGIPPAQAEEMALTRIFSSESGNYGTGLDDATLATDSWDKDDKLAALYLSRMQWAYGPNQANWGTRYPNLNLFAEQLKGVEAAVLSRSSNLYGMLTTDDPFQYLGGLSLAVRNLTGQSPSLYISNLRDANNARVDSAARFLAVELQSRYFHPGWIEAMKAENYAGTLNIVDTLNNFWGWQVTDPAVVRDDQWQSFHEIYVNDRHNLELREWFEQHNPHALAQIVERMLEAVRKDYWDASEQTQRELVETWLDLQSRHDIQPASSQLEPYVAQLAAGFGLSGSAPAAAAGGAQAEQVSGQQLAPAAAAMQEDTPLLLLVLLAMALIVAAGMFRQAWEQRRLGAEAAA